MEKMQELTERSKENEEYILDVLFTAEEVEQALSRLKRKAAGQEGLIAEHLQEAGSAGLAEKCVECNSESRGGSQHPEVGIYYYTSVHRQWQRSS